MSFEIDFQKRLRSSISIAWQIFQQKSSNELIAINKEASMQLNYAYILQSLIPLITFDKSENISIELEKSVNIDNKQTCEIDLLLTGRKEKKEYRIAVEMKCYREFASSGGKRGATDIFMKDVYADIEILEKYIENNHCQDKVFLAMNDLDRLVNPKDTSAKCWDYNISQNFIIDGPKNIQTPIGGKPQNITINGKYRFNWVQLRKYYYLEI